MTRLSEEQVSKVRHALREGRTFSEAGRYAGTSRWTVGRLLRDDVETRNARDLGLAARREAKKRQRRLDLAAAEQDRERFKVELARTRRELAKDLAALSREGVEEREALIETLIRGEEYARWRICVARRWA